VVGSRPGVELSRRYTSVDLGILTEEEARRFGVDGRRGSEENLALAWELLYRLEPELYDRLVQAERLHPAILDWLPRHTDSICVRSSPRDWGITPGGACVSCTASSTVCLFRINRPAW